MRAVVFLMAGLSLTGCIETELTRSFWSIQSLYIEYTHPELPFNPLREGVLAVNLCAINTGDGRGWGLYNIDIHHWRSAPERRADIVMQLNGTMFLYDPGQGRYSEGWGHTILVTDGLEDASREYMVHAWTVGQQKGPYVEDHRWVNVTPSPIGDQALYEEGERCGVW